MTRDNGGDACRKKHNRCDIPSKTPILQHTELPPNGPILRSYHSANFSFSCHLRYIDHQEIDWLSTGVRFFVNIVPNFFTLRGSSEMNLVRSDYFCAGVVAI